MTTKRLGDKILLILTWGFAILTFAILLIIIGYILIGGVPHLRPSLFSFNYTSYNVSMMPSIISTLIMVFLTLIIAVPLGIFTAVFLVEYMNSGSRIVKLVRQASEMLAGIPSIVYGLFGLLLFVQLFGFGLSLIAGVLTLSIMVLPVVMRTAEEALKSVPGGYREGAYALGAGKLRVVFKIVLPSAIPGILAGVILATGRIIGESAALIFTAGTIPQIPGSLTDSARTLSVHMWVLSNEGHNINEAYSTGVILLLIVLIMNTLSAVVAKIVIKK